MHWSHLLSSLIGAFPGMRNFGFDPSENIALATDRFRTRMTNGLRRTRTTIPADLDRIPTDFPGRSQLRSQDPLCTVSCYSSTRYRRRGTHFQDNYLGSRNTVECCPGFWTRYWLPLMKSRIH